jgi:phospholipid/cholesterol/gamma-HCH transport system substrate-binding protein
METPKVEGVNSDLKVGLFVVIGLVFVTATIIILGGTKRIIGSTYDLNLKISSVEGLGPGSVVQLAGYPIGNVAKIEFVKGENSLKVTCKIQSEFASMVTEGATGSLRTQGALGDKYIFIAPGAPSAKPLVDGDWLLTSSEGDLFSKLTETNGQIQDALKVAGELRILIGHFNNEGKSALLARNLTDGSLAFKQSMERINSILTKFENGQVPESMSTTMKHFASAAQKLDRGQGTLGSLLNDSTVSDRLKELVGGNKRDKYLKNVIRDTIQNSKEAE